MKPDSSFDFAVQPQESRSDAATGNGTRVSSLRLRNHETTASRNAFDQAPNVSWSLRFACLALVALTGVAGSSYGLTTTDATETHTARESFATNTPPLPGDELERGILGFARSWRDANERWGQAFSIDPDSGNRRAATGGGEVSGRVIDEVTGQGIEGVTVGVIPESFFTVFLVYTDSQGYYQTDLDLAPGDYIISTRNTLGYHDEAYDDLPFPGIDLASESDLVPVRANEITTGVNFELSPGWARISGRIVEEGSGKPIVEVSAAVYRQNGEQVGWGVTDGEGYYTTFSGIPPGQYVVQTYYNRGCYGEMWEDIRCEVDGCDLSQGTALTVEFGDHIQGIDLQLTPGTRITGRVYDKVDDSPVVGGTVWIKTTSGSTVTTGKPMADGTYISSRPLEPGIYYLQARSSHGYIDQVYSEIDCSYGCSATVGEAVFVDEGETKSGIDFPLTPGATISGKLTDSETGLPLFFDYVYVYDSDGNTAGFGSSNQSGDYRLNGALPMGTYFVKTRNRNNYFDEAWNDHRCGEDCRPEEIGDPIEITAIEDYPNIDFSLQPGPKLSGSIQDAESGVPLPFVDVYVYNNSGIQVTRGYSRESGEWSTRDALSQGTYFLRTRNQIGYYDQLWDGLSCPGECNVLQGAPVVVSEDGIEVTSLDFQLTPGERISGTIVSEDTGESIEARVAIHDSELTWIAYAYSDRDGRYTTRKPLGPGIYYLQTHNEFGYFDETYEGIDCSRFSDPPCVTGGGRPVVLENSELVDGVDFTLERGGQILGRITDRTTGQPFQRASVTLYDEHGNEKAYFRSSAVWGNGNWGNYMALTPGTYYAKATANFGFFDQVYPGIDCPVQAECSPLLGQPLVVEVGKAVTGVNFQLTPAVGIAGKISDETTGEALPHSDVIFYDQHEAWVGTARADSAGRYLSGPLAPGTYFVRAGHPGSHMELFDDIECGQDCDIGTGTPVIVMESGTTEGIDFTLRQGAGIRGTVTDDETHNALRSINVHLFDETGSEVEVLPCGSYGNFQTWSPILPGTYFLMTQNASGYFDELYDDIQCANPCNPTGGTPIVVEDHQSQIEVEIGLRRGSRVMATIRNRSSGRVIENTTILVFDMNHDPVAQGIMGPTSWTSTPAIEAGSYFVKIETPTGYPSWVHGLGPCLQCEAFDGTPVAIAAGEDLVLGDIHLDPSPRNPSGRVFP